MEVEAFFTALSIAFIKQQIVRFPACRSFMSVGLRVPGMSLAGNIALPRDGNPCGQLRPYSREAALTRLCSGRVWCSLDFHTPPAQMFPHFLLRSSVACPAVNSDKVASNRDGHYMLQRHSCHGGMCYFEAVGRAPQTLRTHC